MKTNKHNYYMCQVLCQIDRFACFAAYFLSFLKENAFQNFEESFWTINQKKEFPEFSLTLTISTIFPDFSLTMHGNPEFLRPPQCLH